MKNEAAVLRIKEMILAIPERPGIYLMKACDGTILYIGKARSLKKRVQSYFYGRPHGPKISLLVPKIDRIDVIETSSEVDALLLEAQLIKRYQPRYNTDLRDGKNFPFLKITAERFPRFHMTRSETDRKAVYYGPYTDAKLLREAVRIIHTLFPIRKCLRLPKHACLYYHIGQCLAPCIKPEVKKQYDRLIREIKTFLGGEKKSLIDYLTERMHGARKKYRFEDAQFYKEQIEALGWIQKKRFYPKQTARVGIGLRGTLELKKIFRLKRLPERIVCFDVSNIQGNQAVASKVSFCRELENKLEYRRYKIKAVTGINDYAMIQEALGRMLGGLRDGREEYEPDLILIDGGKGHLNAASEILAREGFKEISVMSIAKQFEYVFVPGPGGKNPIVLPPGSAALRLLQRIRDEAHRFAISYHRMLKTRGMASSLLDKISGIGEKRKRLLLATFSSLDELRQTPAEIISKLTGISPAKASQILETLRRIG